MSCPHISPILSLLTRIQEGIDAATKEIGYPPSIAYVSLNVHNILSRVSPRILPDGAPYIKETTFYPEASLSDNLIVFGPIVSRHVPYGLRLDGNGNLVNNVGANYLKIGPHDLEFHSPWGHIVFSEAGFKALLISDGGP